MIRLITSESKEFYFHESACTRQDSQPLRSDSDLLVRHMELLSLKEGILFVEFKVANPAQDPIAEIAKGAFSTPFEVANPSVEWLGTHLIRPLVFLKNLQEAKLLLSNCSITILVPDTVLQPVIAYTLGQVSPANVSSFLNNSSTVRIRYYDATPEQCGTRLNHPDGDTSVGKQPGE